MIKHSTIYDVVALHRLNEHNMKVIESYAVLRRYYEEQLKVIIDAFKAGENTVLLQSKEWEYVNYEPVGEEEGAFSIFSESKYDVSTMFMPNAKIVEFIKIMEIHGLEAEYIDTDTQPKIRVSIPADNIDVNGLLRAEGRIK